MKSSKLAVSLFLACPFFGFGQSDPDSINDARELNQVVITGTRTPKLLMKSPVLTSVISAKDIAKTDATDLRDLLQQRMPGVEFSYAMNQQMHLNICGFSGQSLLILVDGERLAGETMDDVDFSRLTLDNVDHIEIVKGAASALYGSNAGGGVINIITKNKRKPFAFNLNGRWAKHNEQRYGLSLQNGGKHWDNLFTVNRFQVDNFMVNNGPAPLTRVITTIYGNKSWDFKEQLTYRPTESWQLKGRAGYFFRQLVRTPDTPERYRGFSGGLQALWKQNERADWEASYAFDQYDKSEYRRLTKADVRHYSNVQNSFRLVYNLRFGENDVLTLGTDYLHDYLYNKNLEGKTREQNAFDAFAQYDWNIRQNLELVGALRYDYFSDHHFSRLTPKVSLRYEPLAHMNLRLGYGMGFRAPTLKEKYYEFDMAGIWIVVGDPNLKAEVSHNFNLSAEYAKGGYNFTLNGYYNYITNKIATGAPYLAHPTDPIPHLSYINLAAHSVVGMEAAVQGHWRNGLTARLAYTLTAENLPRNKAGERMSAQYIPARKHSLMVHVDWEHRFHKNFGMTLGIDGRYLSGVTNPEYIDYYDVSKGMRDIEYPGYTLWKLSAAGQFKKGVKVTLALDNLFNYRPKYYYLNSPLTDGINVMLGVSIDIEKLF
ncbi:TonB-dependent receptor [Alloprevotella tannerae]|uniref:TonB-dependent receptor plug domain-containing protein n=1 Tax=Alloprevotella tannerae TaxID=76122 RepID=UPI0028E61875|nr:TonB-dependent receptor [Alloprevotella tannerae]